MGAATRASVFNILSPNNHKAMSEPRRSVRRSSTRSNKKALTQIHGGPDLIKPHRSPSFPAEAPATRSRTSTRAELPGRPRQGQGTLPRAGRRLQERDHPQVRRTATRASTPKVTQSVADNLEGLRGSRPSWSRPDAGRLLRQVPVGHGAVQGRQVGHRRPGLGSVTGPATTRRVRSWCRCSTAVPDGEGSTNSAATTARSPGTS